MKSCVLLAIFLNAPKAVEEDPIIEEGLQDDEASENDDISSDAAEESASSVEPSSEKDSEDS